MEVEEVPTPGCKFPSIRNGNSRTDSGKIGKKRDDQHPKEEEAKGEANRAKGSICAGVGIGLDITSPGALGRICGWPSSRIVRVSRASGGKDRHSKVWTSKGLRDRRVRLSVNTAIEFYHLHDRLGYDQPSKAIEWLLKAATSSIAELPAINTSFPDTPQQLSEEKRSSAGTEHGFDSTEVEMEGELFEQQQQQPQQHGCSNFSKSACSSTSETSKGPGLSLSRSESRIKARVRARERAAEKEKKEHQNVNQSSSFTELLMGGMNNSSNVSNNNSSSNNNTTSPNDGNNGNPNEASFFQKSPRQWSSTPMDYFASGLIGSSSTRAANPSSTSFLGQIHLGNHLHHSLSAVSSPLFTVTGEHHQELQHFSFVSNHLVPVVIAGGGGNSHANNNGSGNGSDYNLNFTISPSSSSGIAGFNRGTLQSNSSSPSLLPHQVQRFSSIDGPSAFFTTCASPPNNTIAPVDNHHHQFLSGFDARLQLCHGDGGHHSDLKRKEKN